MGIDAVTSAQTRGGPTLTVLFLGRLIHDKGADLAVAALPERAQLWIGGDGPERLRLAKRAHPNVHFFGEVHGSEKVRLLASADVLIVPSRQDGAPQVVLEGLAAGLPMVATAVGGIPELLPEGAALLVAPEARALQYALERLRDLPALRTQMSRVALASAARYKWSSIGPRLAGHWLGAPVTERPISVHHV
jgi:glycosyltransferase involved in cell wall biosynthesis